MSSMMLTAMIRDALKMGYASNMLFTRETIRS
jgi:hypothetical protein